jgi:hypothetical protein
VRPCGSPAAHADLTPKWELRAWTSIVPKYRIHGEAPVIVEGFCELPRRQMSNFGRFTIIQHLRSGGFRFQLGQKYIAIVRLHAAPQSNSIPQGPRGPVEHKPARSTTQYAVRSTFRIADEWTGMIPYSAHRASFSSRPLPISSISNPAMHQHGEYIVIAGQAPGSRVI